MVIEEYSIDEPVIVFMGDDILWNPNGPSSAEILSSVIKNRSESAILGMQVPKQGIPKFGVIDIKNDKMTGIVEKPKIEEAPSDIISLGRYVLSPKLTQEIVKYVHENNFGAKDQEFMITDPIDTYIKRGGVMKVALGQGEFLDGGSLEGWLHANNVVCGQ